MVYKGEKGHTTANRHIKALQKVLPLLPTEAEVTLLGDGEYDTIEMLSWVHDHTGWQYVMRTSKNILITHEGCQYGLRALWGGQGSCFAATDVLFTAKEFGPVMAIAWWGKRYKEPLFLITNLSSCLAACRFYRRRFRIETLFSDKKSRGFHIDKSHLSDPKRLACLLLASSLAYLWLMHLGMMVSTDEAKRALIDRTHRTDKSLFRLGLDWVKYCFTHDLELVVAFYLFGHPIHI